jgi:putative transposase
VTYETVRQWCQKFGPDYARKFKKRKGRLGDTWHIDEVFVTIQGQRHSICGVPSIKTAIVLIFSCNAVAISGRLNRFRRLLKSQGHEPRWLVTDKL